MSSTPLDSQIPQIDFIATPCTRQQWEAIPARRFWMDILPDDFVLRSTPLRDVDYATLFAYMHRRFGPPFVGADPYKDLSASWVLMTPDDRVVVRVSPSLSGAKFSFTPWIANAPFEPDPVGPARSAEIQLAYRATLLDLLRPVCVRDRLINALGRVNFDDSTHAPLLARVDGDDSDLLFEVEPHASCGYPMPEGLFGGQEWSRLCEVLAALGQGNYVQGRHAALGILQQALVCEHDSTNPPAVDAFALDLGQDLTSEASDAPKWNLPLPPAFRLCVLTIRSQNWPDEGRGIWMTNGVLDMGSDNERLILRRVAPGRRGGPSGEEITISRTYHDRGYLRVWTRPQEDLQYCLTPEKSTSEHKPVSGPPASEVQ